MAFKVINDFDLSKLNLEIEKFTSEFKTFFVKITHYDCGLKSALIAYSPEKINQNYIHEI